MFSFCVENRVSIFWLTLFTCLAGVALYMRMPVELLPKTKEKWVVVRIESPYELTKEKSLIADNLVRKYLNEHGIEGPFVTEKSGPVQTCVVKTGKNPSEAFGQKMHDSLARENIDAQVWITLVTPQQMPTMRLLVQSAPESSLSINETEDLVRQQLVARLESLPQVAHVQLLGTHESTQAAEMIATGFASSKSSPNKIWESLAQSLKLPRMESFPTGPLVIQSADPAIETFRRTLPGVSSALFMGGDVPSEAFFVWREDTRPEHFQVLAENKNGYIFDIFRNESVSEIALSDVIHDWLEKTATIENNVTIKILDDKADYIRAAESNVLGNLRDGIILTCLCILVFVRNIKTTLIASLSIPISLLMTFPFLYLIGVTRNVMSLAGIALGVGVVVDATLSVVNSIEDELRNGKSPIVAAKHAALDNLAPVGLAVLTTLTVFVPILFLKGSVGELFSDLSLTVILSQVISFVCAIAITPPLATWLYPDLRIKRNAQIESVSEEKSPNLFLLVMKFFLEKPILYTSISIISFFAVGWSLLFVPQSEFLPKAQSGEIKIQLDASTAWGTSRFEQVKSTFEKTMSEFSKESIVFVQEGILSCDLNTKDLTTKPDKGFREWLQKRFAPWRVMLSEVNPLDPVLSKGEDVIFFIPEGSSQRSHFQAAISNMSGVMSSRWSREELAPALVLDKHNDALAAALLPRSAMTTLWPLWFDGQPLGVNWDESGQKKTLSPVRLTSDAFKWHPALNVPLPFAPTTFVKTMSHQPKSEWYYNGIAMERVALQLGTLKTSAAIDRIKKLGLDMQIPVAFDASQNESQKSLIDMGICVLVATFLTAFVIWLQHKSFYSTFVIMCTFIWGAIGSFPGLYLHKETLNSSVLVGFILLSGTIVNNGIILMDLIEKERSMQKSPLQCCMEALEVRTTPVIVTALTTILGMLPMIFETGEGSQMYRGLSIVVVYGTLVSTPISLVVIPCLLLVTTDLREKWHSLSLKWKILGAQF